MNSRTHPRTHLAILGLALCLVLSGRADTNTHDAAEWRVQKGQASLADYLGYAARHNAGLEATFDKWQAALERVAQREALPNPRFTFAHFVEEVETRVGPQTQKFGLMQPYPWFGKLKLRGQVAGSAAEVAYRQYEAKRAQLFFDLKKAYFEYTFLYRAITVTEENIRLLDHLEAVARSKFKAGASQAGVIKAQVELGKLDDRLKSLRDLRGPLMSRLNAALNRPHDAELAWPERVQRSDVVIDEAALFERLARTNPELGALESQIGKADHAIALAKKAYYPDLAFGLDYVATDDALMADSADSGKDPIVAMVTLDIPLWRGAYKAGVTEARLGREAAENLRVDYGNRVDAELTLALYRVRDAERKVDLYQDTLVPQADQALKIAEEVYRSGKGNFLDLIDAERLLLEFQLAAERAFADREIALAEIEKLIGEPIIGNPLKTGEQ
jgi:cobalt-zinc-cadmium efflux system outer membrane protein